MAHYLPFLRVAFLIFAVMGANAIRGGCIGSIALLFGVGFIVGVAGGLRDGSLLSRHTPRSAPLMRLKRRDRGVLTETLTWNRNILYL